MPPTSACDPSGPRSSSTGPSVETPEPGHQPVQRCGLPAPAYGCRRGDVGDAAPRARAARAASGPGVRRRRRAAGRATRRGRGRRRWPSGPGTSLPAGCRPRGRPARPCAPPGLERPAVRRAWSARSGRPARARRRQHADVPAARTTARSSAGSGRQPVVDDHDQRRVRAGRVTSRLAGLPARRAQLGHGPQQLVGRPSVAGQRPVTRAGRRRGAGASATTRRRRLVGEHARHHHVGRAVQRDELRERATSTTRSRSPSAPCTASRPVVPRGRRRPVRRRRRAASS